VDTEGTRGKTRQELGEILNSEDRRKRLGELVDQVMDLKGVQWGFCPVCSKKVQVEVADLKGRVDGMIKLLEQAEGKPQDEQSAGVTLIVERVWPDSPDHPYPFDVSTPGETVGVSPLPSES
jgi:hypothetical protein